MSIPDSIKATDMYQNDNRGALESITLWAVPEDMKNHIVIVGSHKGLAYLLLTLRRSQVHKHQQIVILTDRTPGKALSWVNPRFPLLLLTSMISTERFWRYRDDLANTHLIIGSLLEPYVGLGIYDCLELFISPFIDTTGIELGWIDANTFSF